MRVRTLNNITNYSEFPSWDEMKGYDLLEFHEVLFSLTRWPEYIVKSDCHNLAKIKNIPRNFIYEPSPPSNHSEPFKWRFNPNEMGIDFVKIYMAMKEAIATEELVPKRVENLEIGTVYGEWQKKDARWNFNGERLSYFFSPKDVIWCALLRDINLPEDIQKSIDVHLLKIPVDDVNLNKVKIKITGQFLKKYYAGKRTSLYANHDWIKNYTNKPEWEKNDAVEQPKNKYRIVENALNELRPHDRNRKQGNRSDDEVANEPYWPKAIEEVIYRDAAGIRYYSIPLLRVAITTAANLLLGKFLEETAKTKIIDQSKKGLDNFLEDFMNNEVVSLYTEGGSPLILEFIYTFAYWTVASFFKLSNN